METAPGTATTAKRVIGKPLAKGFDPRRVGSGRKKAGTSKADRDKRAATAKGAEIAAAALDRMRAEIADMDAQTLARWAARPALKLLVETVANESIALGSRMTAAAHLLGAGWHKAPTANVNLNANVDGAPNSVILTQEDLIENARKYLAKIEATPVEVAP